MKLYIPTSSRNFNCIFSEESISPRSFYGERGFGYSKWHDIPENPYYNLIVLYDELRYFERPNEGYDDYPIVIEVSFDGKDIDELFRKDKSGAYLFDGTIYFNPKTTGFIFFSEQHKNIVLSKAEGSLETKLVRIYNKRIRVERAAGKYIAPDVQDAELNRVELAKSIRINKVKGFIYGYHIGNMLAVSKEQGFKVKTTQSMLDLASAIYGSIDKQPTARQTSQLQSVILQDTSLARLLLARTKLDSDSISSLIDEIFHQCQWEPTSDSADRRKFNMYSMILNPATQEQAINYLTSEINGILGSSNTRIAPERAKDINILANNAIELPILSDKQEDKAIAELWVNGELADNKYQGSIASYRFDLATELTKAVRDSIYKDDWEKSSAKPFLNALRRNLNGEEFTEKWDNGVLSAIAAVLMKGDTWDGLRLFLISKGIQNQTLPFAFYGIVNGFANLPKDFTNILLNQRDSASLWGLLNSAVYEAVNGFGMKAVEEKQERPSRKREGLLEKTIGPVTEFFSPKEGNVFESRVEGASSQLYGQETDGVIGEDMPDFEKGKELSIPGTVYMNGSAIEEQPNKEKLLVGHPYAELLNLVLQIIEEETPKKKEVQEYKGTYPAAVDSVFERNNNLVAISNGIESIPASCAASAWKAAKSKIRKLIKRQEDEENSVFRMQNRSVVESLSCAKGLSSKVIDRLINLWYYTGQKEPEIRAHINFFIILAKKEGRGELLQFHDLQGLFDERLAAQFEKELKQHFGIKG